MAKTMVGLVWSRARHDGRRHAAALGAVAILMASFLTFDAVATGMEQTLGREIAQEGHASIQFSLPTFGGSGAASLPVAVMAAWPGVESVHPRSAKATGIAVNQTSGNGTVFFNIGGANLVNELVLVGIDAAAEAALVTASTQSAGPAALRAGPAENYSLALGAWIAGPGQAVATRSAAAAGYGLGTDVTIANHTLVVVGIIENLHAASLNVPGVRAAGHLLVDRAGWTWGDVGGVLVSVEAEFAVIQDVTNRIIDLYPQQSAPLRADLAELERQHFEQARSQQVLSAAGRLVGAAGAATLFAMALFLLVGEQKALGTMAAIGFSRRRIASYMGLKLVGLAVLGCVAGGAVGLGLVGVLDMPTASFESEPAVDAATYTLATVQSLAAALAGVSVAFIAIIRKNPIEALTAAD